MSHSSHSSHSNHSNHSSHTSHSSHANHGNHASTGTATHANTGTSPVDRIDPNTGSPISMTTSKIKEQLFVTTGNSTFTVPAGITALRVLVVAGGGGGGTNMGGGGGGGGVIYDTTTYANVTPGQQIAVTVGAGGAGAPQGNNTQTHPTGRGSNGGNSVFGTLIAIGGGGGGSSPVSVGVSAGLAGGSGGGASGYNNGTATSGGAGTSGQGYAGGNMGVAYYSGGGGGAGAVGVSGSAGVIPTGGAGRLISTGGVIGSYYWGGGGGGSGYTQAGGNGGVGGGGGGAIGTTTGGAGFCNGTPGGGGATGSIANCCGGNGGSNTGGGGGGGSHWNASNKGGDGGSGIVIVQWDSKDIGVPPWTNWGTTVTQFTDKADQTVATKLKEVRDKIVWLKSNKGQTVALDSTQDLYKPNNPAIDVTGAADANFNTNIAVDDVEYDALQASLDVLYTQIGGTASGVATRNFGDTVTATDVNALKTAVDSLAALDKGSPTTPWHHNHSNHANHGSHSSTFNPLHASHTSHASTSDERLKHRIDDLARALPIIALLHSVEYEWIDKANGTRRYRGFIAQEIENIFPEWVEENEEGVKQIVLGPLELEAILVRAIQEQQSMIEGLASHLGS
jgi:hypothetical protein